MSDDINKDNEFSEVNEPASGNMDDDFSEYKPDSKKYEEEQQALNEAHNPREPEESVPPLTPDDDAMNKRYMPGEGPDVYKVSAEDELKKQESQSFEDTIPEQQIPEASYEEEQDSSQPQEQQESEPDKPAPEPTPSAFESAVKAASSEMYDDDTKLFSGLAHLCNVLGFTIIWAPLIIYFIKQEDDIVKFQALQSIAYGGICAIILGVLSAISLVISMACCLAVFLFIAIGIIGLAAWGYAIYITVIVFQGQNYRIPYIADMLDQYV